MSNKKKPPFQMAQEKGFNSCLANYSMGVEKMKLYELSTQYAQVVDMLNEADQEQFELITDTLESISDSIEIKADNIARMITQIEAEKAAIDAETKRLADRGAKLAKQKDSLKAYLHSCMTSAKIDKIKSNFFNISIRRSQAVEVLDQSIIPVELISTKTISTPDKIAIAKILKENGFVDGCILKINESLSIR